MHAGAHGVGAPSSMHPQACFPGGVDSHISTPARAWCAQNKQRGVQQLLEEGGTEEKRELLTALRQMHAVARPDMLISHSQAEHG